MPGEGAGSAGAGSAGAGSAGSQFAYRLIINSNNYVKNIYNYFFTLQLASVIAKIIDKKPTINFKVISSLSIKEPSKIADRGLNPREIAA